MEIQRIKGTKDIYAPNIYKWTQIEKVLKETVRCFGYSEIRVPIFENTKLFLRGIGETTDIVGKEMYSFFPDSASENLTLRPEMTTSVIRATVENELLGNKSLYKAYYLGDMFRKEKPQAGRQRQFTQFGCESIGTRNPKVDAELIYMLMLIFENLGIKNINLKLNSLGTSATRENYRNILQTYFKKHVNNLDEESKIRLEKNPLRILDSKNPTLQEIISQAPKIIDCLDEESKHFFDAVQNHLQNLNVKYELEFRLVRGLDYYSHTAFEVTSTDLGAQDALGGGGRYDGLAKYIGAKDEIPAVGFALGLERILLAMEKQNLFSQYTEPSPQAYFVVQDESCYPWASSLVADIRKKGVYVEIDTQGRSFKSQMREANRLKASFAIIIGIEELNTKKAQVKNLLTSEQVEVAADTIEDIILKITTETPCKI